MKQTRFISVVIATLLLFCSADAFAQRSRGGSGSSGGHMNGSPRSVSRASQSSSNSSSRSVYCPRYSSRSCSTPRPSSSSSRTLFASDHFGYVNEAWHDQRVNYGASPITNSGSLIGVFSKDDVFTGYFPVYGYEVSRRTATKDSLFIPRASGDYYYRDGIFFSKSLKNDHKYVIDKPCSGIRVPEIPASRREFVVNDITYYYYYGSFYVFDASASEYVVVAPPVGLTVNNVPDYAKKIVVDGNSYYIVDNVVYKAVWTEGKCRYVVTKLDKKDIPQVKERMASAK